MNKNSIYILSIVLLLAFSACEKEVTNIKLPQAISKLVVTSFISPQDTLLRISILESVPAIGQNSLSSENIPNATVSMSDGTKSVNFTYNELERTYVADARNFPIVAGNTYFLEVTDTKGRKVEATCTVPINQEIDLELAFDSSESRYNPGYIEHFVTLKWQDTPGEINYYRAFAEIKVEQRANTYSQPVWFDGYDIVTFTDTRLDGARFSSPRGIIWPMYSTPENPIKATLYTYLLNTDEHYYRYHQSIRQFSNTDGNPFAEPVLIYSNVTGGLGVFASYNRNTVSMPLE